MSINESDWSRLDNTAKIFPAISGEHSANVFRLWTVLREEVDPAVLEEAVNIAKEEVPSFNVKMRRGLFWYYFEPNTNHHKVTEERNYPCSRIDIRRNQWFLFKVTYYKNRINLEVFHALADGTGAMYFLNQILYQYLRLKHPDRIGELKLETENEPTPKQMAEDGFLQSDDGEKPQFKQKLVKVPKAYDINGILIPWGNQSVMEVSIPTGRALALAKSHGATITEYFAAVLVYGIYTQRFLKHPENKEIIISIPVNLRSFFPSNTLRNFFIFVRIGINFYEHPYTFDEVLQIIKDEMKTQVCKERFDGRIKQQVRLEKKWIFRIVPRVAKDFVVRRLYKSGERGYTFTLTNTGRVKTHEKIKEYVSAFGTQLAASRNNVLKIAMSSFEDNMIVCFNSCIYETDIQKYFVDHLVGQDIDVTLSYNEVG